MFQLKEPEALMGKMPTFDGLGNYVISSPTISLIPYWIAEEKQTISFPSMKTTDP